MSNESKLIVDLFPKKMSHAVFCAHLADKLEINHSYFVGACQESIGGRAYGAIFPDGPVTQSAVIKCFLVALQAIRQPHESEHWVCSGDDEKSDWIKERLALISSCLKSGTSIEIDWSGPHHTDRIGINASVVIWAGSIVGITREAGAA